MSNSCAMPAIHNQAKLLKGGSSDGTNPTLSAINLAKKFSLMG